jgi:hypothetical protein
MKTHGRVGGAAMGIGMVALVMLSVVPSGARSRLNKTVNVPLDIRLVQPTVVTTGDNPFEVIIKGPDGKAINDAEVSVFLVMNAWEIKRIPKTRNHLILRSVGDGRYTASWNVTLAGPWVTTVVVKQNGAEVGRKQFVLTAP